MDKAVTHVGGRDGEQRWK